MRLIMEQVLFKIAQVLLKKHTMGDWRLLTA